MSDLVLVDLSELGLVLRQKMSRVHVHARCAAVRQAAV